MTKQKLNERCVEYCSVIDIDNVTDAWEWYLFENDLDEEIEPTLEQLDKIMNVDFLKELHEKIWDQISIWLCEQIDKEVGEETKTK